MPTPAVASAKQDPPPLPGLPSSFRTSSLTSASGPDVRVRQRAALGRRRHYACSPAIRHLVEA